jgi:hypothetical protein
MLVWLRTHHKLSDHDLADALEALGMHPSAANADRLAA